MSKRDPEKKGPLSALLGRVGDLIVTAIRTWRIVLDRRTRHDFFREKQEEKRAAAVVRKLENWKARSLVRTPRFSRLRVFARYLRRRVTGFHRRTPLKRLLVLYLAPVAVLSIVLCAGLLLTTKKVATKPLPALSPQKNFEKLLGQTARLIADNHPEEAEKNLAALNAYNPDHPSVISHSGAIALLRKDYPAARTAYERVLVVNPRSYIARYNLAEIDFVCKDYAAAARRFGEILQNKPGDETIIFRLALCAIMQNDFESADRYILKLPNTGRTPARPYAIAARYFQENKASEARKVLAQARTLFGDNTTFYDATLRQLGFIK